MKLVLAAAILVFAALPASANTVHSMRVFSTDVRYESITDDVNMSADKITVADQLWFSHLFGEGSCQADLTTQELPIQLRKTGARSIELKIDGKPSITIASGFASFVPSYLRYSQSIKPHYMMRLQDGNLVHIQIENGWWGKRTLTLSIVVGRGNDMKVVPVFQATGR